MAREVHGVEKDYDWGSENVLREMFGRPPGRVAEMWFGTHPQGEARLDSPDGPALSSVAGPMHMLVKLLSCDRPLSLQTHPDLSQAKRGFAREESAGIARDAVTRMYRDDSDKPEILVALDEFEALCGFADPDTTVSLLHEIGWHDEAEVLDQNGIDGYLLWAFDQPTPPPPATEPEWLTRITALYPDDRGLRVAPLLNHVLLAPGEAVSLPAGNLHAYLRGTGLEVMTSSDNVVRAGFTSKHVDAAELLRIVDTSVLRRPVVTPTSDGDWSRYPSPTSSWDVARCASGVVPVDDTTRIVVLADSIPCRVFYVPAGDAFDSGGTPAWVCTQRSV